MSRQYEFEWENECNLLYGLVAVVTYKISYYWDEGEKASHDCPGTCPHPCDMDCDVVEVAVFDKENTFVEAVLTDKEREQVIDLTRPGEDHLSSRAFDLPSLCTQDMLENHDPPYEG